MAANRDLEEAFIHLEMEKAVFFLRVQNVVESKEEDLLKIMTELWADTLQKSKQEIQSDIDEIYRIHTNYARQHELPREIHVRFSRKTMGDEIYRMTRDEPLIYKEKEIQTLKQIPRRAR